MSNTLTIGRLDALHIEELEALVGSQVRFVLIENGMFDGIAIRPVIDNIPQGYVIKSCLTQGLIDKVRSGAYTAQVVWGGKNAYGKQLKVEYSEATAQGNTITRQASKEELASAARAVTKSEPAWLKWHL